MKASHRLSKQDIKDIVDKYLTGNFTTVELSHEYHCSAPNIRSHLKRRGVLIDNNQQKLQRKYTLDQEYFDVIDTEEKAYFLGLMYADGCNHIEVGTIAISLQECDLGILQKFQSELKTDRPIAYCDRKTKNPAHQNCYKLTINSSKICQRLEELGCWARKSLNLEFPTENQVPPHLIRHFIRGYFDGDGCICHWQNKQGWTVISACIVSTFNFCDKLSEIIFQELEVKSHIYKRKENVTTRQMNFSGRHNTMKFVNWLYSDCSIYLDRKYNKVIEINELMNQMDSNLFKRYSKR